jgi:thiamine biosynthesis lipoprotein
MRRLAVLLVLAAGAAACRRAPLLTELPVRFPGYVFNLEVTPALAGLLPTAVGLAQNTLDALRLSLDESSPDSDISRVNRLAASVELPIQPVTYQLLFHAKRLHAATGGAFDLSTAPIAYAWGFKGGPPPTELPDRLVDTIRHTFGMDKLNLREFSATLRHESNALDIAPILPGFLVDHMVKRLRDNRVTDFLLTGPGVARAWGRGPDGLPWAARLPAFDTGDGEGGGVRLQPGQALGFTHAFSDFRELEGRRISHVIHPLRGRPVEGVRFAAALAPSATEARALSVALLVKGVEGGSSLLLAQTKAELLLVTDEPTARIYATPGFRTQYEPTGAAAPAWLEFPPPPPAAGAPSSSPAAPASAPESPADPS